MSPFLEYHSSAKAARAYMILVATYILLRDCTDPFTSINFLGLSVTLNNEQLLTVTFASSVIFGLILLLRITMDNPWKSHVERLDSNLGEVRGKSVYLSHMKLQYRINGNDLTNEEENALASSRVERNARFKTFSATGLYVAGRIFLPFVFTCAAAWEGTGKTVCG